MDTSHLPVVCVPPAIAFFSSTHVQYESSLMFLRRPQALVAPRPPSFDPVGNVVVDSSAPAALRKGWRRWQVGSGPTCHLLQKHQGESRGDEESTSTFPTGSLLHESSLMFLRRPQPLVAPRPPLWDEVWRARSARQTSFFPSERRGETRPGGAGKRGED